MLLAFSALLLKSFILSSSPVCPPIALVPKADVAFIFKAPELASVIPGSTPQPTETNPVSVSFRFISTPNITFRLQNLPSSNLKCLSLGVIHADIVFTPVISVDPKYTETSCPYAALKAFGEKRTQRQVAALTSYNANIAANLDKVSEAFRFPVPAEMSEVIRSQKQFRASILTTLDVTMMSTLAGVTAKEIADENNAGIIKIPCR